MVMRLRSVPILATLAVAALAMSACGATEEGTGSSTSGAGQSGAAASGADASAVCTGGSDDSAADPTELTLALVPSGDANKLVESVKPLEDALSERLGIPVKGVITQDYQAAVEAIGSNQAQIGMLPSLQMSQACDRYQAVPALQSVRKDKTSYAAQFFTNNPDKYCADEPTPDANGMLFCNGTESGQGPAGLDALPKAKGATISLLQPASPAGYIFPVAALQAANIKLDDLKVTQVTANDASVQAVYKGDTEVGTSYWDARTVVAKDTPDVGQKVVVFALTDEIPNDGVSISGKLNSKWQEKITSALLDFAGTPEGSEALNSIYQITGLKPADVEALQKTQATAATIGVN